MASKMAAVRMLLTVLALAAPAHSGQGDRHYTVRGMVLRVDAAAKTFFVSHERIEGLMDSMTMPFEVRDVQLLQGVGPGAPGGVCAGRRQGGRLRHRPASAPLRNRGTGSLDG